MAQVILHVLFKTRYIFLSYSIFTLLFLSRPLLPRAFFTVLHPTSFIHHNSKYLIVSTFLFIAFCQITTTSFKIFQSKLNLMQNIYHRRKSFKVFPISAQLVSINLHFTIPFRTFYLINALHLNIFTVGSGMFRNILQPITSTLQHIHRQT